MLDFGWIKSIADELDNKAIKGALMLSDKSAGRYMSKEIYSVDLNSIVDASFLKSIQKTGFTRIPVINGMKYVGVLNSKSLISVTEEGQVKDYMNNKFLTISTEDKLDDILQDMMRSRIHMALVESYSTVVGVLTMEDILEELVLQEIEDETDS